MTASGQQPLELDDSPFPGLVDAGLVRAAKAEFLSRRSYRKVKQENESIPLAKVNDRYYLLTGGILKGSILKGSGIF